MMMTPPVQVQVTVTVTVQVTFVNLPMLPMGLLLPMRLVQYNGGNRKLTITAESGALPQPIVEWLQSSPQYRQMIGAIGEIN